MFNVASSLLLVALALSAENAFGTNQHLICKAVDDIFSDGTPGQAPMRREALQGPPGKRGQTGVKGEPGAPGSNGVQGLPGLVDPQDIENVVQEKVTEATREYQGRIQTLEEKVLELTSTAHPTAQPTAQQTAQPTAQTTAQPTGQPTAQTTAQQDLVLCDGEGFVYKTKCYNIILHANRDTNYAKARELCTAKGGKPADILYAEHQSLVADYVRKKTNLGRSLWTGMSYRTSTGTLRLSNGNDVTGNVAASITWWSGFPSSASSRKGMGIMVSTTAYGLFNYPPSNILHGVLCEK